MSVEPSAGVGGGAKRAPDTSGAAAAFGRADRGWLRLLAGFAALAFIVLAGAATYKISYQEGEAELHDGSDSRLDLFASAVEARVRRLESIPATVQLNPSVLAVLHQPTSDNSVTASAYLARLNAHLASAAVYVVDQRGVVLASSNSADKDDSLIGEDISYRKYFLDALAGRASRHFAIGSGGTAGYYVSHPIYGGARVIGVAAIKIDLDAIDQAWTMLAAPALVVDADQVVILSSKPQWLYTSLEPLTPQRRVDLKLTRTYGSLRMPAFPLAMDLRYDDETQEVRGWVTSVGGGHGGHLPDSAGAGYMVLGRSLDGMDWRVLIFSSMEEVRRQALAQGLAGSLMAAFLVLLALFIAQRRRIERQKQRSKAMLEEANSNLELQVQLRTEELTNTNRRLREEVAEREQAERTLREAQDELVHAGKMAVLGQMAASVTHELAQPLGGIRTLAGNAAEFMRRGNLVSAENNLSIVARLVDQMATLVNQLKGFSRKSSSNPGCTDVGRALAQALFLFQVRMRNEKVTLINRCAPLAFFAWCDAGRLEQVLINLVGNALDAMRDQPLRQLSIEATQEGEGVNAMVELSVQDSGKGLTDIDLERMFEPFYTTKTASTGIGLGLAISRDLVAEFKGELRAERPREGGARFVLRIPACPEERE